MPSLTKRGPEKRPFKRALYSAIGSERTFSLRDKFCEMELPC